MIFLYIISLLSILLVTATHHRHFHRDTVMKSVSYAKDITLKAGHKEDYRDRLAIMFISSTGLGQNATKYLKCSLLKLQENLLTTTPGDIYIWVPEAYRQVFLFLPFSLCVCVYHSLSIYLSSSLYI